MDAMPWHPKLVHLPIALSIVVPLLSAAIAAMWWRGALPRAAWWLAVGMSTLLCVSSFAAMRSGENDEELVERVVAHEHIEAHEEAAERFTWATVALWAAMLVAGVAKPEALAKKIAAGAAVASFALLYLSFAVGDAGGALVYRHGAAEAHGARSTPPAAEHGEHGH